MVIRCDLDRKSTRLNSSHITSSYAVFRLKKKNGRQRSGAGDDEMRAGGGNDLPGGTEDRDVHGDGQLAADGFVLVCFFFNDTAATEIYTLSLHDALPISDAGRARQTGQPANACCLRNVSLRRSEEHTSELQSHHDLVCRLLLEKKKK